MKPAKNEIVEVYHEVLKRLVRGKWTGKRWMIFNELFGGYDPAPFKVKKWQLKLTQELVNTCKLDRGICSHQYGLGCLTGCSSTQPCDNKWPVIQQLGK